MEQRTDRRSHQPPENIEASHVWKSEIRLVENKSLGWIEARRRAETVINNCDALIRGLPRLLHQKLGRTQIRMPKSLIKPNLEKAGQRCFPLAGFRSIGGSFRVPDSAASSAIGYTTASWRDYTLIKGDREPSSQPAFLSAQFSLG
jgi:hypothetical protein